MELKNEFVDCKAIKKALDENLPDAVKVVSVWEGTMSDIAFDPDFCRNIATDIRYILFVIEKVGGAGYLIDEMDLVE